MKKEHRRFIKKLKKYLSHPGAEDLRITQALHNLGVTLTGSTPGFLIDNYNESDKVILHRMNHNMKKRS